MEKLDPNLIVDFYRRVESVHRKPLEFVLDDFALSNENHGIGDTVVITAISRAGFQNGKFIPIQSISPHFKALTTFNPYYREAERPFVALATRLQFNYDLGNGHFIQRLERAFGITPELKPRGCLVVETRTVPGRTVLHFKPSDWARRQRAFHPRAREIYPETLAIIQEFIQQHPEMHFVEVGNESSALAGVEDWTNLPLTETITRMATAEYFMGPNSGPLHLAAALGLKTISIINFPDPSQIWLPVLKNINLVESFWLYPQSVILHQDCDGPAVKRISIRNLELAIEGDLYPYWSDEYLGLISEV